MALSIGGGILSPSSSHSRPDTPSDIVKTEQLQSNNISSWDGKRISKWLKEQGLESYESLLKEHSILSGAELLQLTEEHFKEMGVSSIGKRLLLANALDRLRLEAGFYPNAKYCNTSCLLDEMEKAKNKRCLENYPRRIILIRHAESCGNVDTSVYANTPDSKLEITEKGRIQARQAGVKLKEMIGNQTVSFYVSPFVRSLRTFEGIKQQFDDDQIVFCREEPRIREQEWGNFQNPKDMGRVMDERRKIGSFFYRFPTGESGADVYDRASIFLESLYRDMYKGKCGQNTLIVSHGLFCRLFLTRFYHWPLEYFHRLWNFENCQFAVMELQEEGYYKLTTELIADPPTH